MIQKISLLSSPAYPYIDLSIYLSIYHKYSIYIVYYIIYNTIQYIISLRSSPGKTGRSAQRRPRPGLRRARRSAGR